MKVVKALMILAAAGYSYHAWQQHNHARELAGDFRYSSGNFRSVAMPDGAERNRVLILAPLNCPSTAAKRADALAAKLDQMGIPNTRSNTFHLHYDTRSADERAAAQHASEVLGGEIPAVFINGMGKANPSPDEVAEIFRRTAPSTFEP
jgi:hypothetical protein